MKACCVRGRQGTELVSFADHITVIIKYIVIGNKHFGMSRYMNCLDNLWIYLKIHLHFNLCTKKHSLKFIFFMLADIFLKIKQKLSKKVFIQKQGRVIPNLLSSLNTKKVAMKIYFCCKAHVNVDISHLKKKLIEYFIFCLLCSSFE